MKVLFADARATAEGFDFLGVQARGSSGVMVSTSDVIPEDEYGRLVVVDRGDEASWRLVKAAVEYKRCNPSCDLMLVNRIDPNWSPLETLARASVMRRRGDFSVDPASLPELFDSAERVMVKVSDEGMLFEYET